MEMALTWHQGLSPCLSGSIFISERVYDEICNQENLAVRELGYIEIKNVLKPVRIFATASG